MDTERPRKVYALTNDGQTVLNFTEGSLNLICKTMGPDNRIKIGATVLTATGPRVQRKTASTC